MTSHRTASHALAGIGAALLMVAVLSGCTPEPEPTPTPTAAFASEEEAFAAAEEVYEEYLAASAKRAAGDASSAPESFLTGDALQADVDAQRTLKEQGISISGSSTIHQFSPVSADTSGRVAKVVADVCVDISASRVVDTSGTDVTPADRPDRSLITVTFTGSSAELFVASSSSQQGDEC
ncbi:hypothetical protein ACI3KT_08075 [Microbacterium sp. ZW T6_19]|uniref:hypothetical protein n=1 Tax=Microbacterium sp. ZW T6_19 TaxID=3378082 RepID=UPI0038534B00